MRQLSAVIADSDDDDDGGDMSLYHEEADLTGVGDINVDDFLKSSDPSNHRILDSAPRFASLHPLNTTTNITTTTTAAATATTRSSDPSTESTDSGYFQQVYNAQQREARTHLLTSHAFNDQADPAVAMPVLDNSLSGKIEKVDASKNGSEIVVEIDMAPPPAPSVPLTVPEAPMWDYDPYDLPSSPGRGSNPLNRLPRTYSKKRERGGLMASGSSTKPHAVVSPGPPSTSQLPQPTIPNSNIEVHRYQPDDTQTQSFDSTLASPPPARKKQKVLDKTDMPSTAGTEADSEAIDLLNLPVDTIAEECWTDMIESQDVGLAARSLGDVGLSNSTSGLRAGQPILDHQHPPPLVSHATPMDIQQQHQQPLPPPPHISSGTTTIANTTPRDKPPSEKSPLVKTPRKKSAKSQKQHKPAASEIVIDLLSSSPATASTVVAAPLSPAQPAVAVSMVETEAFTSQAESPVRTRKKTSKGRQEAGVGWNSDEIGASRELYQPRPSRRRSSVSKQDGSVGNEAAKSELVVAIKIPTNLNIGGKQITVDAQKKRKPGRPPKQKSLEEADKENTVVVVDDRDELDTDMEHPPRALATPVAASRPVIEEGSPLSSPPLSLPPPSPPPSPLRSPSSQPKKKRGRPKRQQANTTDSKKPSKKAQSVVYEADDDETLIEEVTVVTEEPNNEEEFMGDEENDDDDNDNDDDDYGTTKKQAPAAQTPPVMIGKKKSGPETKNDKTKKKKNSQQQAKLEAEQDDEEDEVKPSTNDSKMSTVEQAEPAKEGKDQQQQQETPVKKDLSGANANEVKTVGSSSALTPSLTKSGGAKPIYRVGLSRKSRIAPLLKIMKK